MLENERYNSNKNNNKKGGKENSRASLKNRLSRP